MRIGKVIGKTTLTLAHKTLVGGRFLLVRPFGLAELRSEGEPTGDTVVVYDELGADQGMTVAFSEGREGAMPFHPAKVPVDAYCSAILDEVQLRREDDAKL
jgi:ethanolamine utilization protein EutN